MLWTKINFAVLIITYWLYLYSAFSNMSNAAPITSERTKIASIEGDTNLFMVGSTLFKIASYLRPTSLETVVSEYRRRLGTNNGQGGLAGVKTFEEFSALSNILTRNQYKSALIGLRLGRTQWHWIEDGKPLSGQGSYAVVNADDDSTTFQLNRAIDCSSSCSFVKKKFASFQKDTSKCACFDVLPYDQSCGTVGCTKAQQFDFYAASNDTFDHWATTRPQMSRACATISLADGNLWLDRSCDERLPFLCQFDRWAISSMRLDNKACSEDKCFGLFKDRLLNFDDAQKYCSDNNGNLLKIDNFKKQLDTEILLANMTSSFLPPLPSPGSPSRVKRAWPSSLPDYIWIGARNTDYVWSDGTPTSRSVTKWDVHEPDLKYDCVAMESTSDGYRWRTRPCDGSNVFVLSFTGVFDPTKIADIDVEIDDAPPLTPTTTTTSTPATSTSTRNSSTTPGGLPVAGRLELEQMSSSTPQPSSSTSSCGSNCGILIFLGVICAIQFVVIVILIILLICRRRKQVKPVAVTPPPPPLTKEEIIVPIIQKSDDNTREIREAVEMTVVNTIVEAKKEIIDSMPVVEPVQPQITNNKVNISIGSDNYYDDSDDGNDRTVITSSSAKSEKPGKRALKIERIKRATKSKKQVRNKVKPFTKKHDEDDKKTGDGESSSQFSDASDGSEDGDDDKQPLMSSSGLKIDVRVRRNTPRAPEPPPPPPPPVVIETSRHSEDCFQTIKEVIGSNERVLGKFIELQQHAIVTLTKPPPEPPAPANSDQTTPATSDVETIEVADGTKDSSSREDSIKAADENSKTKGGKKKVGKKESTKIVVRKSPRTAISRLQRVSSNGPPVIIVKQFCRLRKRRVTKGRRRQMSDEWVVRQPPQTPTMVGSSKSRIISSSSYGRHISVDDPVYCQEIFRRRARFPHFISIKGRRFRLKPSPFLAEVPVMGDRRPTTAWPEPEAISRRRRH